MTMRYLILVVALTCQCRAATWYCRPPVISDINSGTGKPIPVEGVYGSQDGTSYASAWNGLREVVWGAGGVVAGDTLYVCGPHVHRTVKDNFLFDQARVVVAASGTSVSPITIRMDYATDPGEVFGFFQDNRAATDARFTWRGPDANGVYEEDNGGNASYHVYGAYFESSGPPTVGAANVTLYSKQTTATWVGSPGSSSSLTSGNNETNFVKTVSGTFTTNVFSQTYGYLFDLQACSNIVFSGCAFYDSLIAGTKKSDGSLSCNHITFTNTVFTYGSDVVMHPGWDDWTFQNCSLSFGGNGIYTFADAKPQGANRLTVSGCTISDMALAGWFLDQDGHGIGLQGSSGCVLQNNSIQRTGSAIEFWTDIQPMTNNIVRWNFIKDISVKSNTTGNGIGVSGNNPNAVPGLRAGFQIYGNVIENCGAGATQAYHGRGISSNNRDTMLVANNTIYNCTNGIYCDTTGYPLLATIKNNAISSSVVDALHLVGTGTPTVDCDYNLLFNVSTVNISPSFTHDTHSLTSDPLFVSVASPPFGFMLQPTSPGIHTGASVGALNDYRGFPFANPPSIGAFEFGSLATAVNATVTHLSGQ